MIVVVPVSYVILRPQDTWHLKDLDAVEQFSNNRLIGIQTVVHWTEEPNSENSLGGYAALIFY